MKDQELINKFGTPFYLYDIPELKKRVDMMRSYQKDIGLCYAMKAAPLLAGYIAPYVDRLEVCSPGEYEICLRDGISPEKILVSGVNKTEESMKRILSMGGATGLFTIESPEHFRILDKVSKELSSDDSLRCFVRLTSGNQFGVDKSTLEELCKNVIDSEHLTLVGIHFFSGTQKNIKKIENELTELTEYGRTLSEALSQELALEYGPGLGIDYFKSDQDTAESLFRYNESDLALLMDVVERTGLRNSFREITFEYGRYIAATCGKYYTGVADVKESDGVNYAILEGGLHQITYYGSMSGMKVPPIELIPKQEAAESETGEENDSRDYVLAGSLCSVNDILVRRISLRRLDIGDTLCFNLTGAYAATEGIALFLSRDLPAIVIRDINGSEKLVRKHTETNIYNGGYHG